MDFSYGLDVEIRPKLTPGASTQVQYSTLQYRSLVARTAMDMDLDLHISSLWFHGMTSQEDGNIFWAGVVSVFATYGCLNMTRP